MCFSMLRGATGDHLSLPAVVSENGSFCRGELAWKFPKNAGFYLADNNFPIVQDRLLEFMEIKVSCGTDRQVMWCWD